ncbi:izumo sperm-egg fusion protein 1 [Trichosurus vulpecula]|uniref:izumo sperm-egg fusion protein 1 n=1 Tax=Trichosurus vulpecula TaxID=9337 RepID=UPI00186AC9DE|nr:izumo sperm-egg fusion protein 1 [Trichosurus vulpecula]
MGDVVKSAQLQGTSPEEPRRGIRQAVVSSVSMSILLRSALPLGFVVLVLALSPRRAWGCILCDPAVVAGLRDLEHNYLPSHMDVDSQVLQTFVSRLEETVREFSDLPFEENSYQGVIDEPTLSKASWAFLKELRRIRDSDLRDNFLLKELTWTLHMQKENFVRLVAEFQRESFCPNKCGLMMQTLIWCFGCEKQVHSCEKSYDCGAQTVRVTENGDMVLDCELSWHKAAEGLTDYRFYRVWPNGSEILISRGQESALTKPMVSLEDSGVYRCILGTVRVQRPATVITYHVKVDQEPGREEQSIMFSTSGPRKTLAPTTKSPPQAEPGLETEPSLEAEPGLGAESGPCTGHGDVFADSGQNAARILNITLIGLVAGGAAAVLGSLALTLYCARRAGLDLGRAGK